MKARHRFAALFSWTDRNADGLAGAFTNRSADKDWGTRMSWLRLPFALALASLIAAGALLGGSALPAASAAEACPNEAIRVLQPYGKRLPDCRAYEQVTPINKNGANPTGGTNFVQTSADGSRINFLVLPGMPGAVGESEFPQFLAARGPTGWSSEGLLPPTEPGNQAVVLGWSESLSKTAVELHGISLRATSSGTFQQVVAGGFAFHIGGFSADESRLIFESRAQLLPNAAGPEVVNLYEWNASKPAAEQLSLAGILPDGSTPPGGSFAGPYAWAGDNPGTGGASEIYYTQNTISADGSRVFFTTGGTEEQGAGQLYVRENGATTVQVSASQRAIPDPNGAKPAAFMTATPDGSQVLFTSCQMLTNDSTAVSTPATECTSDEQGQDLYSYDATTGALSDLTNESLSDPSTVESTHGAAVQGVVGTSLDGSYVYFVANGVLAPGATPGNCLGIHAPYRSTFGGNACNLYLWHNGAVTFIARQNASTEESDVANWSPTPTRVGQNEEKTSRVSTDGGTLLFRSQEQLTSYDNQPADPSACRGQRCSEIYRYEAAGGRLACVSCDPTGAPPTGQAKLQSIRVLVVSPPTPAAILTRNLSADGSRIFFESLDALVPQDTNGQQDVYQWEQDGRGSCERAGGCLSLLSSGQSTDPAFFADASVSGNDAFLFTSQPLVSQDQDQNVDIYDARVGGGIAAQNPSPVPICQGESCKAQPEAAPNSLTPGSSNFVGPSNPKPKHHHKRKHHRRHQHHHKGKHHGARKHKKPSGHHNGRKL